MPLDEDPKANLSTIHVVYSANERHFPGLLASMLSLARHAKEPARCSIHVIVEPSDLALARSLAGCLRRALAPSEALPEVLLHELKPLSLDFSTLRGQISNGRPDLINPLTFAWFNIQEYLPDVDRAIYLDADTIVRSDLGPLYRMRMGHAVAGVPHRRNLFIYRYFLNLASKERLIAEHVKVGRRKAYNSGVMVFDLRLWRSGELTQNLEAWTRMFDGAGDADQLALNLEFQGVIDSIDWRWNSYGLGCDTATEHCLRAGGVPARCIDEARILHFNGPIKPWLERGRINPHRHVFDAHRAGPECGALR